MALGTREARHVRVARGMPAAHRVFQPSAPRRARRRRSRQSEAPMGRLRTPEALRGGETMPGSPPRTPISNDSREVYPESRLFPLSYQRGGLGVGTGDVGLARAARVHAFLLSMHPLTCLEHTSSSQKERPDSHLRSRKISILSRAERAEPEAAEGRQRLDGRLGQMQVTAPAGASPGDPFQVNKCTSALPGSLPGRAPEEFPEPVLSSEAQSRSPHPFPCVPDRPYCLQDPARAGGDLVLLPSSGFSVFFLLLGQSVLPCPIPPLGCLFSFFLSTFLAFTSSE